jgi:DNA-binding LacI/PurR family transcriptional regulator
MARATSLDVARAAGVSRTTVSFVLNGQDQHGISAETRLLVLETAERLGYVPSAAGRALRTGRSNVVLCVVPNFPGAQSMEQFKIAFSRSLGEAGYACVFLPQTAPDIPLARLWQHVHPAVVVAFDTLPASDAAVLGKVGVPLLDGVLAPDRHALTGLNQEDVGRLQVEHLAARGHRHIGYAALADPRERPFSAPRLRGAIRACQDLGLPAPRAIDMEYSRESAREAVSEWTGAGEPVTAVAAFNDQLALAVLAICLTEDIAVPGDLALIGVDDLPIASLAVPALTSVSIDLTAVAGALSARVLVLAGEPEPASEAQPTPVSLLSVVQRETT